MAGLGRRIRKAFLDYIGTNVTSNGLSTIYVGFSTVTPGDDASTIAEPTIGTGSYARAILGSGGVAWSAVATPTAGQPAKLTNSANVTWGPSSASGWSTGTTPLGFLCYWTASTGVTEATFVGFGAVSTPPQVNAAGVTLTAATAALEINIDDT